MGLLNHQKAGRAELAEGTEELQESAFAENVEALCDPADRGQGFLIRSKDSCSVTSFTTDHASLQQSAEEKEKLASLIRALDEAIHLGERLCREHAIGVSL